MSICSATSGRKKICSLRGHILFGSAFLETINNFIFRHCSAICRETKKKFEVKLTYLLMENLNLRKKDRGYHLEVAPLLFPGSGVWDKFLWSRFSCSKIKSFYYRHFIHRIQICRTYLANNFTFYIMFSSIFLIF